VLRSAELKGYSPELNPDEWVWKNVKHDDIKRAGIQRGPSFSESPRGRWNASSDSPK